jgi:hypothetical protein
MVSQTPGQNIRLALAEALAKGLTPEQAADALRQHPQLFDFVRPLLVLEARSVAREHVRATERRVDAAWQRARPTASTTNRKTVKAPVAYVVPQELLELRSTSFSLGDGTRVGWFDATVEQHEARIDMQRKLMAGIELDVGRHREAIRVLRETGARNLAALPSTCFQDA